MKRHIYNELLEWKNNNNKKPLMVFGARQIGKTYTINKFCQNEFNNYIYLNLMKDKHIVELFKENIDFKELISRFKLIINNNLNEDTILFIDEIQVSPEFITNLKFFYEDYYNINIICAGSLLGVMLNRVNLSFPVGKVDMLDMYPMSFDEFLIACKEEALLNEIERCFNNEDGMYLEIHNKAILYYKYYLCIGGMPESVLDFINNDCDLLKVNKNILSNIIKAYVNDMSKYIYNKREAVKISRTYNSLATQLLNDSSRFQYSKIERGGSKRKYEFVLDWLINSNVILQCRLLKTPELPLESRTKLDFFKLYLSDVGILNRLLKVDYSDIMENKLDSYKGVIVENYVANHLVINNYSLIYWKNENNTSEVDFIIRDNNGDIIPLEVKSSYNTQSKSLNVYIDKYKPKYAIRLSPKNFGINNNIKSIPLYAIYLIKNNLM